MLPIVAVIIAQSCSQMDRCDGVVSGPAVFDGLVQAYGDHGAGHVGLIVIRGSRFGGPLAPVYDGQPLRLRGARYPSDPGADVMLECGGAEARDAGGCFGVYDRNGAQVLVVDWKGNVVFGPTLDPDGTQADDVLERGMLKHANGASGAIALDSYRGNYLKTRCHLGETRGLLPDGGEPAPGPGVACDGGHCWYEYAGHHGCHTLATTGGSSQMLLLEAGPFAVGARGAFGSSCIPMAQFPTCPRPNVQTNLGQFFPGAFPGQLLCDAETESLHMCRSIGWAKLDWEAQ